VIELPFQRQRLLRHDSTAIQLTDLGLTASRPALPVSTGQQARSTGPMNRAGQQDCPRNAAQVAASTCEVTGSPASAWKRPTAAAVSAVYIPQRPGSPTDGSALIDPTL
jgi:hypothetical protein